MTPSAPPAEATRPRPLVPRGALPPGITARHPAADDGPALEEMWARCTPATRLARVHSPVRTMPASYVRAVLAEPGAGLVATESGGGTVVGLASLFESGGGRADLGVVVEDRWQRCGIGAALVAGLVAAAPGRGISVVTASVLTERAHVAQALRRIPGRFAIECHGPTVEVAVRLGSVTRS